MEGAAEWKTSNIQQPTPNIHLGGQLRGYSAYAKAFEAVISRYKRIAERG
jgi:hypothetical protein